MKIKILLSSIILSFLFVQPGISQNQQVNGTYIAKKSNKKKIRKKRRRRKPRRRSKRRRRRVTPKVKKSSVRVTAAPNSQDSMKLSQILNSYLDEDYEKTILLASKLISNPRLQRAANYYIALSFANMELFRSSMYYFGEVVKMGIGSSASTKQYYQQAVNSLLQIAEMVNDDTVVPYLLKDVSFSRINIRLKDKFYYYLGKYYYFTADYNKSISTLKRVSKKSQFYSRAQYVIATAYVVKKRYGNALNIYKAIGDLPGNMIYSDLIRDKSNLALARLFYGFGQYKISEEFYEKISDDSPLWHTTVFESSWAYFMNKDYNKVLGRLEVINSKFYDDKFVPEYALLRLVVLLKMCRIFDLRPGVKSFKEAYGNIARDIAKYVRKFKNKKKILYKTFENYFAGSDEYYGLPKRLVAHVAMEEAVFKSYYKIYSIFDEKRAVDAYLKYPDLAPFFKIVSRRLSGYVKDLQKEVSTLIRRRIVHYDNSLGVQVDKSRLVELQYMDEEKQHMEKAMVLRHARRLRDSNKKRYLTLPEGYIYWPFQGEYWLDEMGYYEFRKENLCRE